MKKLTFLAFAVSAMWLATTAMAADFVVIVNKANTEAVDKAAVASIYTGQKKSWSDGQAIMAIDLAEDSPTRASFCSDILGKTVGNLKTIWAQMVFSGKALPPKTAASDEEMKKLVSQNKGAIGYIKASSADDSVKVVIK